MLRKFLTICFFISLCILKQCYSIRDSSTPKHGKVVACYVATWAAYRPAKGSFKVKEDLRPEHCTHLIYAFAGLNASSSSITSLDPWRDLEENYGKDTYRKMTGMRSQYPNLKVSLGIGGWNEGSANYSAMASSPNRRGTFVDSVVHFLIKYNFDGLDLDWEFPGARGGAPYDKENFARLVKELHDAFQNHNLILTAAISADKATIDRGYDIPEISKYLDYIHVMAYDYHGAWNKKVLPNAPINCDDGLCIKDTMEHLIKKGAPPAKIVLGLPMYGKTFILRSSQSSSDKNLMGAATLERGFAGPYTREDGFMGYNEICKELLNSTGWKTGWDEKSSTPYAVNSDSVIVYDNPKSLTAKVEYALKMRFAGVMIWSIDTDDFRGECASLHNDILDSLSGIDYPLMRTINAALAKIPRIEKNNINDSSSAESCHNLSLTAVAIILLHIMQR